jgi:predicted AAA+ superfamily ATPase
MVFVGGPRQVGKTTLAKNLLPISESGYLNWDIGSHREKILKHELPNTPIWFFDEIHKYSKWRDFLKGIYDQYQQIFSGESIETKRWSREYRQRLIQEDLVQLENVKKLEELELIMMRLPKLVGSPLSINALREDLQVSHNTVANGYLFLKDFMRFFDYRLLDLETASRKKSLRFKNMVGLHLLKWIQFEEDTKARGLELRYFRDIDRREVDFIITEKTCPIMAIECK